MGTSASFASSRARQAVADEARRRPRLPLPASAKLAVAVAALAWLGVVVAMAVLLPDQVPLHWGFGPEPDRWGGKAEALGLAFFLGAMGVGVGAITQLGSFSPDVVNLPDAAKDAWYATPERVLELNRIQRTYALWFTALMLVFGAATSGSVLQAALTPGGVSPVWFWPGLALWLVGLGVSTWWLTRVVKSPERFVQTTPGAR